MEKPPKFAGKPVRRKEKSRTAVSDIAPVLSEDPIWKAVKALNNSREVEIVGGGDSKDVATTRISYNADVLSTLRSMFSSDRPYRFRLSKSGFLTNGTAILQVNIATDLTVFAEGAALTALFDEVKLQATRWQLVSNAHTTQFPFVIGYEPVINTAGPTTASLLRLPCSTTSSTFVTVPIVAQLDYRASKDSIWGLVSDEGVSTPRTRSGLNGTFSIANYVNGTAPTTGEVSFCYTLTTLAHFRKRG
jgi:hypothetical protein